VEEVKEAIKAALKEAKGEGLQDYLQQLYGH
jgi:hypothetical protein